MSFFCFVVVISSMSKPDFLNQRIAFAVVLSWRQIWPWKLMALSVSFLGNAGCRSLEKVVMMALSVKFGLQLVIFWAMVSQSWDEPNCWVSMAAMMSISNFVMGLCMGGIVVGFLFLGGDRN